MVLKVGGNLWKSPIIFIGGGFLAWRILLLLLAFLAPFVIPEFGDRFPYRREVLQSVYYENWFWPWGNFDGVHYLRIAKDGYQAEFTQAFFPFFPSLIGNLGRLFLGEYLSVGFLISNLSFFVGLIFFFKLLSLDYSLTLVRKTVIFLLLFPTSFFFGAIYTEGLFFLLIVLSFYYARKDNFVLASFFAFFASLTRFIGVFLLPALVLEHFLINKKFDVKKLIWLLLIPLGLGIYMTYLALAFGNPFYFVTAQPIFGAERTGMSIILFPQVIWRYIKIFLSISPQTLAFHNALFEFVVAISFLVLIISSFFKIRLSWAFFSFLAYIAPTLTGTFSSMPRYVIVLFPCFLTLGLIIKNRLAFWGLSFVFMIFLIVWTLLFVRGYWVA